MRYGRFSTRVSSATEVHGSVLDQVMTENIPFHDVKKDTIVIKRVIQGDLPPITEHARMSLTRDLCSLMSQCWNDNPSQRPTGEECRKLLNWMVSVEVSAQTYLNTTNPFCVHRTAHGGPGTGPKH